MKEEHGTSFDEAKHRWQEQSGQGPRLTRAWLHVAVTRTIGRSGRCERCELQLALSVGLSAAISVMVFLSGNALYRAHWQNQTDFVALWKSFATVIPFENEQ